MEENNETINWYTCDHKYHDKCKLSLHRMRRVHKFPQSSHSFTRGISMVLFLALIIIIVTYLIV